MPLVPAILIVMFPFYNLFARGYPSKLTSDFLVAGYPTFKSNDWSTGKIRVLVKVYNCSISFVMAILTCQKEDIMGELFDGTGNQRSSWLDGGNVFGFLFLAD